MADDPFYDFIMNSGRSGSGGVMKSLIAKGTKMKLQGRKGSNNIEDRRNPGSPDDRSEARDRLIDSYAKLIGDNVRLRNSADVPTPARRPDGFLDAGLNINDKDLKRFGEEYAEQEWVLQHSNDLNKTFRGKSFGFVPYEVTGQAYQPEATQFLLDSFKAARKSGIKMPWNSFVSTNG